MATQHDHDGDLAVAPAKPALQPPQQYQVVIHNDDFTPMDFVVAVLHQIFGMNVAKAQAVMEAVHHEGKGICGIFSREVAETKVVQTTQTALSEGHPLRVEMEPVENTPRPKFGL
jgi:ATP-dependent Clp protease adaptor protein ClpS